MDVVSFADNAEPRGNKVVAWPLKFLVKIVEVPHIFGHIKKIKTMANYVEKNIFRNVKLFCVFELVIRI